jgi:hypothetical protein
MKTIFYLATASLILPEVEFLDLFSGRAAVLHWQITYIVLPTVFATFLLHRRFQLPFSMHAYRRSVDRYRGRLYIALE